MANLTGGCQCGAVQYELTGPFTHVSVCHCRMCQRATGSYLAPLAGLEAENFRITTGEMSIYASSPVAERGYCAKCGSPLTFRYVDRGDISVTIGSLDDPDAAVPTEQFGIESTSAHWHTLNDLPGSTTEDSTPADVIARIQGK